MTKKQHKILVDLMNSCNKLGHTLDYTAVSRQLIIDRQQSLMLVYKALYGFFGDNIQNDYRDNDLENAEEALNELRKLTVKVYTDSSGNLFHEEEIKTKKEQEKGIYKFERIKL